MLKKQIAMLLSIALILASVPITAISADGSEKGLDYLLGDVIYENDFQSENGGVLPGGWSVGYPSGTDKNRTSFGWGTTGAAINNASVTEHDTYGKVLEFTASNTDAFLALPQTGTMSYVFEAEIIIAGTTSIGLANNFYAPTYEADGTMYSAFSAGSQAFELLYRGNGGDAVTYSLPTTPAKLDTVKLKLVSITGKNYLYYNGTLVGISPWRTPSGTSDNPGFYTYNGSMYIKNVRVTSIFEAPKFVATRLIANSDKTVDIQTEYSFNKNQSAFISEVDGNYVYSESSSVKLGVVTAVSESSNSDTIDVNTSNASVHYFSNDEITQNSDTVNISVLDKNIADSDFGKYINYRPFICLNGKYYYGKSASYLISNLANGAYLSAVDASKKALLDELFENESGYVVGKNAEDITFTVFSDFHYKEDMYPSTVADLKTILKRADESDSSLVISAGDFCNDMKGSPELYNTFLGHTGKNGEILPALNVYGNHELEGVGNSMDVVTPTLTNAVEAHWGDGSVGHDPEDNSYGYYYVDIDGFRFICLDNQYSWNPNHINGIEVGWEHSLTGSYGPPTAADNANRGYDEGKNALGNTKHYSIGSKQLAWFENVAMDAAEKDISCVMISHLGYSYLLWNGGGSGGEEIRAVTAKANAKNPATFVMGLSGHYHTTNSDFNGGIFFMDVNSVRNVYTDGPASDHYTDEHTYMFEQYDDDGNLLNTYERPLNELYWSSVNWYSSEPLSAVVHLNTAGIIEIEGTESDWAYGVQLGEAQQAINDTYYGQVPYVEDKLYSKCDIYGHAEVCVDDGNGHHHIECRAVGCNYKSAFTEEHSYNNCIETDKYLAKKTDCGSPAEYYYSCDCGNISTDTFTSENAVGHKSDVLWENNDTHHWHICEDCNEKTDYAEHVFDRKVTTSNYLAYSSDCPSTSTYYYSCECGMKGTATFESVNSALHSKSSDWSSDETGHWHACDNCDVKVNFAAHSFNVKNKTEDYIAVPTDENGTTVYYYACECGYKGTETYEERSAQPGSVWDGTAYAPTKGSGTKDDPYQISVAQELAYVARLSAEETQGKYYELTYDIYINDPEHAQGAYTSDGYTQLYQALPWPSGAANDHSLTSFGVFAGDLNGNGHRIVGLYNEWAPNGYWGLFGSVAGNTVIKNVNIDSLFYRRNNVTSWNWSNTFAGGIVGAINGNNVTIEACTVYNSTITETASGWTNAGGIVGVTFGSTGVIIKNCGVDINFPNVRADFLVGGIIGDSWGGVNISGCWSNNYPADNDNTNVSFVTYTNCYTTGEKPAEVSSDIPTGLTKISGSVKGENAKTLMPNLEWDTVWKTVDGKNPLPATVGDSGESKPVTPPSPAIASWDGTRKAPEGAGTEKEPYIIKDASELAYVVSCSADETSGKYYEIANDIYINDPEHAQGAYTSDGYVGMYEARPWPSGVASDYSLATFGEFAGTLNGKGHRIVGLYNEWAPNGYWGLFGTLGEGASIKNIIIDSLFYRRNNSTSWDWCNSYAAGIAGQTNGKNITVAGCSVIRSTFTETAENWAHFAGIIGDSHTFGNILIQNCLTDINLPSIHNQWYNSCGIIADRWDMALGENIRVEQCVSNVYPVDYSNGANAAAVQFTDCYTVNSLASLLDISGITVISAYKMSELKGATAVSAMPKLGWSKGWVPAENAFPIPHAHEYGVWIVDKKASSEADGSKHRDCTLCEASDTAVISKIPDLSNLSGTYTLSDETTGEVLLGGTGTLIVPFDSEVTVKAADGFTVIPKKTEAGISYTSKNGAPSNTASLNLEGEISINYYLDADFLTDDSNAYVIIYYNHDKSGKSTELTADKIYLKDITEKNAKGAYKLTVSVCAAQINDYIHIELYDSDGVLIFEKRNYSVKEYCLAGIKSSNTKLAELCKAIINYGGYSQKYFNYRTDVLANADGDYGDINSVTAIEAEKTYTYGATGVTAVSSVKLEALSNTSVKFKLSLSGTTMDDYSVSLDTEGAHPKSGMRVKIENGYIVVYGIESSNLDFNFTVTVTHKDGSAMSINYSAMTFCKTALEYSGSSDGLKDWVKALYLYNAAANAYFE